MVKVKKGRNKGREAAYIDSNSPTEMDTTGGRARDLSSGTATRAECVLSRPLQGPLTCPDSQPSNETSSYWMM